MGSVDAVRGLAARLGRGITWSVGRPAFWVLFVGLVFLFPVARALRAPLPKPLPVLGTIPAFRLADERGQPFGSSQLVGRAWVASFLFTRCPTACPVIAGKMSKIQHRARNLGTAFHLVSFTADPDYDTPERLAEYARRYRASPRMWTFLSGPADEIRRTVVQGLKVTMSQEGPTDDLDSFVHGTHLVLVDSKMRIRGYYPSSEAAAVDDLLRDLSILVGAGG